MAGSEEEEGLLNLSTMAGIEASQIPVSHMGGMQVLGEAVTQAEFLAEHVILQDLTGNKTMRDIADIQAQLRGIGELASLQTIQSEHAYPASTAKASKGRPLLKEAEEFVRSTYPDVVTLLVEDSFHSSPFLIIYSKYPDSKFLVDQSSLRLNIKLSLDLTVLICTLLTYNREVVRRVKVKTGEMEREIGKLVENLLAERYHCCAGLTLIPSFSKIEKSDILQLMIEKYDGRMIYRARQCSFIVDQEKTTRDEQTGEERPEHCPHCRILSLALASKDPSSFSDDSPGQLESDLDSRRKRGRPKGSRKRIREEEKETVDVVVDQEQILRELAEEVEKQERIPALEETQATIAPPVKTFGDNNLEAEDDFGMEDDPDDLDFHTAVAPKRARRKKTLTKKGLEMETSKLRPGRKPKVTLPMTCPEEGCRQHLETVAQFREHQTSAHTGSLVCLEEGCLMRFPSTEELEAHTRRHKGEKPFSCQECKREYSTRQDLRLHFRKHTGEKPFPCDQCEKEFARKAALRIHKISVHSELKSYLCADCGAAFKANSALIDHKKRVHMQIKPHHCEFCGKEFFSKKDYGEHCRTHTGEKPYQCQLCGKCFNRAYHLKRHTDGVHRNPPGPGGVLVGGNNGAGSATTTPHSPNNTAASLTIDSVATIGRKSTLKKIKDLRPVVTSKQPGKTSLLTANLAFTNAQTVHTFDLKSLTPTVTVEKGTEKEEDKPFAELKELSERAPLDLKQRGNSLVSLLAEQRRESSPAAAQEAPTSALDPQEPVSRQQTIMVTSAHNFPSFSSQPTYLMTGYYRGQDGQEYVEAAEHEVETEKIYKL